MEATDQEARDGELRSVANALRLLARLAQADGTLGVTELSRSLGVAPSTAYRLLSTLAAHGFATRLPDERRYRRGPVRGADGEVLASLGISGPASRVGRARLLAALAIEARATADEITLRLTRRGDRQHS